MVCGFQFAVRSVCGIGLVVESAVGQRTAKPFVKEQKQQRDLNSFGSEAVGIATSVAFKQGMALELAQIITELVESIGFGRKPKASEDGVMDFFGGPTADGVTAVQQNFEQADHAGVVDLDSGIANRADGNGQGKAPQQGKSS